MQFYVNADGTYAVTSLNASLIDLIEVPEAPPHANAVWSFELGGYLPQRHVIKPIPRYDFWRVVDVSLKLKKEQVLAAIETSDLDDDAKYRATLGITDAQTYIRDDPNVVSLLSLMGFPAREADDFWLWAQPA